MAKDNWFDTLKNDELSKIIDNTIKNKRNREILKSRLIDGVKFDELAEMYDLSVNQTKNIVYKCIDSMKTLCRI